jgi:hypothetical protein
MPAMSAALDLPGSLSAAGAPLDLVERGEHRDAAINARGDVQQPGGPGRLISCRIDELRPHAAYARHHLATVTARLSALAEQGDLAFHDPLIVTRDRTIIDGYCRCDLARRQGRTTVTCIEYDLTEDEALLWLLRRHGRSKGLNDFCRILLALELEPSLKTKALANQQSGGQSKGSSKLTEAERVDVRSEIAAAAGVSLGNVTKVKQVIATACTELQDALRNGEVSIHRAWLWRELSSENQRQALMQYRGEKGVKKTIRRLISKHRPKKPVSAESPGLTSLARRLLQLQNPHLISAVAVAVVDVPGKAVFITEELLQLLPAQEELPISCFAESH